MQDIDGTQAESPVATAPAEPRAPWISPRVTMVEIDEGTEDLGSVLHFFVAS